MSRRRPRAGYTMIEVMVALAILAVGASGVIAIQKATLIGNRHAKNLATANAIAKSWAERLRVDSLQWNDPNQVPDLYGDTDWLSASIASPYPEKVTPPATEGLGTPNADVLGTDIFMLDTSATAFCTHLRFRQYQDPVLNTGILQNLMRVEIRVFWARDGSPVDCSAAWLTVDHSPDLYGAVYLTTAITRNTDPD